MKCKKTPKTILITSTFLVLLSACTPQINKWDVAAAAEQDNAAAPSSKAEPRIESSESDENKSSSKDFLLPTDLSEIESTNVNKIELVGSIHPNTPPFFDISSDGRFLAKGESGRLTIFEVGTNNQVAQYEVEFPNCGYGFEKYFQFSHDGSFIAVITKTAIQVLQTGGGIIYENPHTRTFSFRYPSCGYDLPQVVLSPDGKLLAVTGIDYSRNEPRRYFRVVDVITNEVLYEWNGHKDTLHGDFSGFFGLGFSSDGELIQTFDPKRFLLTGGVLQRAFRFWSTRTWKEVTNNNVLRSSFEAGGLLFPLSDSDQLTIFDKLTGKIMSKIPAQSCEWDKPCEAAFSKDGTKAMLLPRVNPQAQFGNSIFFREVEIWDLEKEEIIRSIPGFYRNLDGLQVTDSGDLINLQSVEPYLTGDQTWWVTADLFQGLQTTQEGEISFVPNRVGIDLNTGCQFCNTCILQIEPGETKCNTGVEGSHGWYSIQSIDGEYWLVKHNPNGDGPVGKLSLQPPGDPESQRMRLSGYSEDHQIAFYCLDVDFRPRTCVIDNLGTSQLVDEFADMSFLRMSPEGNFAAFIDSFKNALYIFDLDTQKPSRRSHYQARAAFTNAVFSEDGRTLYYLIENLKNPGDFSIEILDVIDQKVIKRFSLGAEIYLPKALAINQSENLLAVANSVGDFVLISIEQPKESFLYQTSQNRLMGIGFGLDDKVLVVMDNLGNFYLWGIEQ